MRLIVLLVAASIFTAASVDSVKCVKFTNPYRDAECDANEKCFSYTTCKFDIWYYFKLFSIDKLIGFSNLKTDC